MVLQHQSYKHLLKYILTQQKCLETQQPYEAIFYHQQVSGFKKFAQQLYASNSFKNVPQQSN